MALLAVGAGLFIALNHSVAMKVAAALLISGAATARELWCSGRQGEKALRKATNGS
jgi:hypothetical protein